MDIDENVITKIGILLIFLFVMGLGLGDFTGLYSTYDIAESREGELGITLNSDDNTFALGPREIEGIKSTPFYIIQDQTKYCTDTKSSYTFYAQLYPYSVNKYAANELELHTKLQWGSACDLRQEVAFAGGSIVHGSWYPITKTTYDGDLAYAATRMWVKPSKPGVTYVTFQAQCAGSTIITNVDQIWFEAEICDSTDIPTTIDKTPEELRIECEKPIGTPYCENNQLVTKAYEYINSECVAKTTYVDNDYCYNSGNDAICERLGKVWDRETENCVEKTTSVNNTITERLEACAAQNMLYDLNLETCVDKDDDDDKVIDTRIAIMLACANADLKYNPDTNACITDTITTTTTKDPIDPYALAFFAGIAILFILVTPAIVKKLKETRGL